MAQFTNILTFLYSLFGLPVLSVVIIKAFGLLVLFHKYLTNTLWKQEQESTLKINHVKLIRLMLFLLQSFPREQRIRKRSIRGRRAFYIKVTMATYITKSLDVSCFRTTFVSWFFFCCLFYGHKSDFLWLFYFIIGLPSCP